MEVIENLRDMKRKEIAVSRKENRYKVSTVHRTGIDNLLPKSYSPDDIHQKAIVIKKKKEVNRDFLVELSQVFAASQQNCIIFSGVDGSLQSLCGYLTGGDSTLQLETAYCIANLALWEDELISSSPLASITGAYFITLLGSGNSALIEACCWALSNMLPQGKHLLCGQGLLEKLLDLIHSSPIAIVRTAAVQCVVQLVTTSSLSNEDLKKIAFEMEKLLQCDDLDIPSVSWLVYLLSFFQSCDDSLMVRSVNVWCYSQLQKQLSGEKKITVIVPLVRFFSNLSAANDELVLALLSEADLFSLLKQLLNFSYQPICKETLLWVSNITNNLDPKIQLALQKLNFKDSLEKDISSALPLL